MAQRANKKDELCSRLEEALSGWHLVAFTSSPATTASATTASAAASVSLRSPSGTSVEAVAKDNSEASALGGAAKTVAVADGASLEEQILGEFAAAEDAARSVEAKLTEVGQLCHQYQEYVAALQRGISVSVPPGQVRGRR